MCFSFPCTQGECGTLTLRIALVRDLWPLSLDLPSADCPVDLFSSITPIHPEWLQWTSGPAHPAAYQLSCTLPLGDCSQVHPCPHWVVCGSLRKGLGYRPLAPGADLGRGHPLGQASSSSHRESPAAALSLAEAAKRICALPRAGQWRSLPYAALHGLQEMAGVPAARWVSRYPVPGSLFFIVKIWCFSKSPALF